MNKSNIIKDNILNCRLKVVCMGFDWNNIGLENQSMMMSKLDRDGLNVDFNEFVLLHAGLKINRQEIRKKPRFFLWHFYFLSRLRIFYDILFIIFLPIVLIYEKFKPDVFYLCDFPHILSAIIPAKFCRSKIYFRLVNLPTQLALTKGAMGKLYYFYYWLMERITILFVDRFIVINETTKKYLMDLGIGKGKIIFDIPDTIARDRVYIEQADKIYIRKKHNIPTDKKIILSIGSLISEKGFVELIKAFAELKRDDLILIICGHGKEEQSLKYLAEKLRVGKQIVFVGHIDRQNIWNYFANADIFMLFSRSESLGMVFWEAMYVSLPVIGTSVGGVKETIGEDGERGFYWKDDLSDLQNKIGVCLDKNSQQRTLIIRRAKDYVEQKIKFKKTINDIVTLKNSKS